MLFYLLDRHALLAMTMESKYIFLNSLTTPPEPPTRHVARGPVLGHPSNGGELVPRQDEGKVPLCGGVARSAGVVIVPHPPSCSARHPPPKAVGILIFHIRIPLPQHGVVGYSLI